MIRLTFIGEGLSTAFEDLMAYYRVTQGMVWTGPGSGPIATWAGDGWMYQGRLWPGMRFEGNCRLILGLPRDPVAVSEPLSSVSVSGRTLFANGLPFAIYDPAREHWHGVLGSLSWPAFRIEAVEMRDSDPTRASNDEAPRQD